MRVIHPALASSLVEACAGTDRGWRSGIWRFELADYGAPDGVGHSVLPSLAAAREQRVRYLETVGTDIIDASPVLCCGAEEACHYCPDETPQNLPVSYAVCEDEACVTVPPTLTPTPGPNDCCQGETTCGTPAPEEVCEYGTEPVYNAACSGSVCRPHTPTPTPGPGDCCALMTLDEEENPVPVGCVVPIDGRGCVVGTPAYGVVCGPGGECVAPTATPTPGPLDCCATGPASCTEPEEDPQENEPACPEGIGVYNAECGEGGCATRTPTPTAGPLDCCEPVGAAVCDDPIAGCIAGDPVYGAVCTEFGCATPTPGPDDCCEALIEENEWMCAAPPEDDLCEAHDPPMAPVYNAECSEGEVCVTRTPTPTPTATPLSCYPSPTPS